MPERSTFDFDSAWAAQCSPPFNWTVHDGIEVEMPGSRPAGLVLHMWRVRAERGDEAELTILEMSVAAEQLFGPDAFSMMLADRNFTEDKLAAVVRAVLSEYARREVQAPNPKSGPPASEGLPT